MRQKGKRHILLDPNTSIKGMHEDLKSPAKSGSQKGLFFFPASVASVLVTGFSSSPQILITFRLPGIVQNTSKVGTCLRFHKTASGKK